MPIKRRKLEASSRFLNRHTSSINRCKDGCEWGVWDMWNKVKCQWREILVWSVVKMCEVEWCEVSEVCELKKRKSRVVVS